MLNDCYQNVNTSGYFKRYGVINGIKRGVFNFNPLHIIGDYEIKKILWQKKAAKYIRKYLQYKEKNPTNIKFPFCEEIENPVWFYWNTGIENAPDIVKACYKSVERNCNGKLVLLDENNIGEYIIFPEYIKRKVNNGSIPIAGYTDLMRFSLVEHYGGTWIDSTVYLSSQLSNEIINTDFFVLRNTMMLVDNPVMYPAWFLHAKKNNKTIKEIRNVTYAYWKKERHVIEYLLPNLIITALIKNTDVEKNMPYFSTDYSEYLIKSLNDNYEEKKWSWIMQLTNIHKLTYKLDKSIERSGTMYRHLIEYE